MGYATDFITGVLKPNLQDIASKGPVHQCGGVNPEASSGSARADSRAGARPESRCSADLLAQGAERARSAIRTCFPERLSRKPRDAVLMLSGRFSGRCRWMLVPISSLPVQVDSAVTLVLVFALLEVDKLPAGRWPVILFWAASHRRQFHRLASGQRQLPILAIRLPKWPNGFSPAPSRGWVALNVGTISSRCFTKSAIRRPICCPMSLRFFRCGHSSAR